jgi:transposase
MGKGTGLSRGDARGDARLLRLRGIVGHDRAILAIDLADRRQVLAVCAHDSRVLARRSVRGAPGSWRRRSAGAGRWRLATALAGWWWPVSRRGTAGGWWPSCASGWPGAGVRAAAAGGSRPQSRGVHRAKSDPSDAVAIARLVGELRWDVPERADQVGARLRQLGARRVQRTTQATVARHQLRDLLECAWPAVLETAARPLDSGTWRAGFASPWPGPPATPPPSAGSARPGLPAR